MAMAHIVVALTGDGDCQVNQPSPPGFVMLGPVVRKPGASPKIHILAQKEGARVAKARSQRLKGGYQHCAWVSQL